MPTEEPARPGNLTPEQAGAVYTAIWQNINREDSNSHNRIIWALSLTSGQFIAISFLINLLSSRQNWTIIALGGSALLSGLGVFFCFRTRAGLAAAHRQIDYLKGEYYRQAAVFNDLGLPRPFGEASRADYSPGWLRLVKATRKLLRLKDVKDPGRRSCATYVQALQVVWSTILIACVGGLLWTVQARP